MSVVLYTMEQLGILQPLQMGFSAIVIIGLLVYVLKKM